MAAAGVIDVVYPDMRMSDENGLEASPKVQAAPSAPVVIVVTGF